MNLSNSDPNFSVVVPGPCNAKCDFCFWKETKGSLYKGAYLRKLETALAALPSEFRQCSITGGEPTASSYLLDILTLVRARFPKVVMSSNGFDVYGWVFNYIDHLNISRHHWDDAFNVLRFGTTSVPNTASLTNICKMANQYGVDVTLNCVVRADFADRDFVRLYLDYAKIVGANAVCFRKEHGTLDDLPVETFIHQKVIREGGCPACRTKVRLIDGMQTTWRYGLLDPTTVMQGIYELVFQQDGRLTSDWDGKNVIKTADLPSCDCPKPAASEKYVGCSGCSR